MSKPLVEIEQRSYQRVKEQAAQRGQTIKRLISALLNYGLNKLENNEIHLVDPHVAETPASVKAGSKI